MRQKSPAIAARFEGAARGVRLASRPTMPARATILVVDDDDELRDQIVELLSQSGHDAVGVSNGLSALRVLEHGAVDLVMVDVNMPLMGGPELLSELAPSPALSAIPVLAIS